ncbi:hypothetical protein ACG74X_17580 [Marivita sp. S0852]|uniref:hypothetical protein n=1 Tax=Marivita sp. S0852 TaxID=3373893 RepID=UPI003981E12C
MKRLYAILLLTAFGPHTPVLASTDDPLVPCVVNGNCNNASGGKGGTGGQHGTDGQDGLPGCDGGTDPSPDGKFYIPGTDQECNPGPGDRRKLDADQ